VEGETGAGGQGDCAQEDGVFAGDGVTLQNDAEFEEYLKSFELRLGRQPAVAPCAWLPEDLQLRPNFSSKWLSGLRKRILESENASFRLSLNQVITQQAQVEKTNESQAPNSWASQLLDIRLEFEQDTERIKSDYDQKS